MSISTRKGRLYAEVRDRHALRRAVSVAGRQLDLARKAGCSKAAIGHLCTGRDLRCAAARGRRIEAALDVEPGTYFRFVREVRTFVPDEGGAAA